MPQDDLFCFASSLPHACSTSWQENGAGRGQAASEAQGGQQVLLEAVEGSRCWGPCSPHWSLLAVLSHRGPMGDAGLPTLQPVHPPQKLLPSPGMWSPSQHNGPWQTANDMRRGSGRSEDHGSGQAVSLPQPSPLTHCPAGCRGSSRPSPHRVPRQRNAAAGGQVG